MHAVNGCVLFATSRGQKVVSLSSAESELHALVGGARDGVFIRQCLKFLTGGEVQHVCLKDNSATRQITHKIGSGKLRRISGRLLWCQEVNSSKELEVKQIGTIHNVSDIGAKPLSQQRLKFLLRKRHADDGDGSRVGDEERQEVEERERERETEREREREREREKERERDA